MYVYPFPGSIQVNGGDGDTQKPCGGGGGGMASIEYQTGALDGTITATGGTGGESAAAGTIYIYKGGISKVSVLLPQFKSHLNLSHFLRQGSPSNAPSPR